MGHLRLNFRRGCFHSGCGICIVRLGSRLGRTGLLKLHILDDQALELAVLNTLLDRKSGIIGMEPYDDLPAVLLADHGITQGIQIFAKALCSRLVEILVQDDGEGSAVKILQLGFCRLRGSLCSGFFCGLFCHSSNLLAQVSVIAALEELDQSLSAAVDNACLFENGQKVRCLGQDFITVLDHLGNKGIEIFNALVRQFFCLVGNAACYGQDRTFLGLHDSLVGSFHRSDKGVRHQRNSDLVLIADNLAESTQKLGKDNARIAARAAQGSR